MASLMEQLRQLKEANQKMKEKKKQRDIENEPRKKRQSTQISARQSRASRAPGSEGYTPTKTDMGPNMSQVNKPERKKLIDKMPDKTVIPPKPEGNIASRVDNSDNTRIGPNMNQVNKPDVKPAPKKDEDKMKWARGAMKSAQGLLQRPTSPSDYKKGGKVKKMKKGGSVKRNMRDGICVRGKTKGRII